MSCGGKPASAMVHANDSGRTEAVWLNARLATLAPAQPGLGVINSGAIAVRDRQIAFAGPQDELPAEWRNGARRVDCEGRWITPALIDCHTHLVFGGERAHEFELELKGATYEEIARGGGGILLDRALNSRRKRRGAYAIGAPAAGFPSRGGRRNNRSQIGLWTGACRRA